MRQKFADLLRYCSKSLLLEQGVQAHGALLKMGLGIDLMLSNDLIDMYGKCGCVSTAYVVFEKMVHRNVVSWTSLMSVYVQHGDAVESLSLLYQMGLSGLKPNDFTLSTNLKACGILNDVCIGRQIHGICVKSGYDINSVIVGNAVSDMYLKCGKTGEASCMFENLPYKNLVSYNAMIAGYVQAGYGKRAMCLFRRMRKHGETPDEFTLTSTFKACTALGAVSEGNQLHGLLITSELPYLAMTAVAGALIDFHVKCDDILKARKIFDQIERKNLISWSALILGYAQEGNLIESMELFRQLRRDSDAKVDGFMLSSVMSIFADFALAEQGKQMHAYTTKVPCGLDLSVSNSILDMYLKCGLVREANRYFDEMPERNVISWTSMITGYGKHGLGKEAVMLFNKMQKSERTDPDDVAYLALLLACSHSGLIEEGKEFFSQLIQDSRIKPRVEHYACMVDLLGRSGRLKEAKELIDTMPLKPNIGIWQALLSGCRVHGDIELGREVGNILLRLDSENPVNYVMVSNIFANAGCWNECEQVRETVRAKKLKKEAGCSWVEVNKEVHFFYGGDDSHQSISKIHEILKRVEKKMKEELGFVYGVKFALHDVEEESKEEVLRVHSEKLAIGFALLCNGLLEEKECNKWKREIRVFKNLRVCGDCHEFIKGLSKILEVVFVVRDANRFHRFEDGFCSCRDYW